jgi:hypothetical protein
MDMLRPLQQYLAPGLLFAYLLVLPSSHAFELHPWVPPPFLVLATFILLVLFTMAGGGRIHVGDVLRHDLWLWFGILWITVATAVNVLMAQGRVEPKQVTHLASYWGVVLVYYYGLRLLLGSARWSSTTVLKWSSLVYLAVCVLALLEMSLKTYWGIDFDSYIPRLGDEEYFPLQAESVIRPRGLTSESGNLALYLELLGPVIVGHLWVSGRKAAALATAAAGIIAFVATFSAAGLVALGTAYGIGVLFAASWTGKRLGSLVFWLCVPIFLSFFLYFFVSSDSLESIWLKLTFVDEASARDRLVRWQAAWAVISAHPLLGVGAGGFLEQFELNYGIVSWWIQLAVEAGLPAVLCFALFFMFALRSALHRNIGHPGYFVSIAAAAIHYMAISDYWLPWLWFVLALLALQLKEQGLQPEAESGWQPATPRFSSS